MRNPQTLNMKVKMQDFSRHFRGGGNLRLRPPPQ